LDGTWKESTVIYKWLIPGYFTMVVRIKMLCNDEYNRKMIMKPE
jgi:hypothetical protein